MFDVAKLTVGQEIGIYGRGDFDNKIGHITKINRHGHITVAVGESKRADGSTSPIREYVFDRHGDERGREKYFGLRLCDAADVHAARERREIRLTCNNNVRALLDEINGHRNGNGDYVITADTRTKIIELANALTTL